MMQLSDGSTISAVTMERLFRSAVKREASDLFVTVGVPPALRMNGEIHHFDLPPLTSKQTQELVYSILSQEQIAHYEKDLELDFAVHVEELGRFRGNVFRQRGNVAAVFRLIPSSIPNLESLNLPPHLAELARLPQGLILFTGPTGHGKSTAQAALIDLINNERRCHIVTIEDPIEYLHFSKQAIVEQREVGPDTHSFAHALKHVLRQDPDVLLVGEMRDIETMGTALTAAETGHLVLATLHTNSALQSIDRIIDSFPPHQQAQVRTQLSFCLSAIVSIRLLPAKGEDKLMPAVEILRNIPSVANLIREGKTEQITTVLETQARHGMQTMDSAVTALYKNGIITRDTAEQHMMFPQNLPKL